MATTLPAFPTANVIVLKEGFSHEIDAGVEVFSTDRSIPTMRTTNNLVIENVTLTLEFSTRQAEVDFVNWYKRTIKRVGRFTWYDPRARVTRTCWLKEGKLGSSTPVSLDYETSQRTVTLQYLD